MIIGFAVVADSGRTKVLASHFGFVGASYGGGMLIGPQIGKALQAYGWYWPYVFASAVLVLNFFYVLFILPDSKPETRTSLGMY